MNGSSVAALELIGIWFPGNGCPVLGSISWIGIAEKSPFRSATVGTVAYWSNTLFD